MTRLLLVLALFGCGTTPYVYVPNKMQVVGEAKWWAVCEDMCKYQDQDPVGLLYETPNANPICVCADHPFTM